MDYLIDDSDQLKLCPFCGAVAEIVTLEGEDGDVGIGAQCVQCTACGSASGLIYPLMDDVTNLLYYRWNRRHNGIKMEWQPIEIEQLTARVRELEEENARLNSSPTIEACRQMIRDKAVIEASTLPDNGKDKVAYFLPEGVTK